MPRIDEEDLNLFDFDYDLTFMVFFLDADGRVYARYGGRDAEGPDTRQSLAGLHYTMRSVLAMHAEREPEVAPRRAGEVKRLRDVVGSRGGGCLHCHQVKEVLYRDLQRKGQWSREFAWRYPLPENIGLELEVDRGNVVKQVRASSPAAAAAMTAGDVVRRLGGVPIHSIADVQFARDRAPREGEIDIVWQHQEQTLSAKLHVAAGWRRTDTSWRPSLLDMLPSVRLYGEDLPPPERQALGLSPRQLAFRHREAMAAPARAAGIRPGDVILGFDGEKLEMDAYAFIRHVERTYFVGERVTVNLLRDGKRVDLPMTLQR